MKKKRCCTSLIISAMHIGTTTRHHVAPARAAVMKKTASGRCWRGCGEQGSPVRCGRGGSLGRPPWPSARQQSNSPAAKAPKESQKSVNSSAFFFPYCWLQLILIVKNKEIRQLKKFNRNGVGENRSLAGAGMYDRLSQFPLSVPSSGLPTSSLEHTNLAEYWEHLRNNFLLFVTG